MHHYRRKRLVHAASGLVVDGIVVHGRALWLTIPNRNGTTSLRLEDNLADSIAYDLGDAPPRPCGRLAQRVELFLAQIDLRLLHVCQFRRVLDIRQWRSRQGLNPQPPRSKRGTL